MYFFSRFQRKTWFLKILKCGQIRPSKQNQQNLTYSLTIRKIDFKFLRFHWSLLSSPCTQGVFCPPLLVLFGLLNEMNVIETDILTLPPMGYRIMWIPWGGASQVPP